MSIVESKGDEGMSVFVEEFASENANESRDAMANVGRETKTGKDPLEAKGSNLRGFDDVCLKKECYSK